MKIHGPRNLLMIGDSHLKVKDYFEKATQLASNLQQIDGESEVIYVLHNENNGKSKQWNSAKAPGEEKIINELSKELSEITKRLLSQFKNERGKRCWVKRHAKRKRCYVNTQVNSH